MKNKRVLVALVIIITAGFVLTACAGEDVSINEESETEEIQNTAVNDVNEDNNQLSSEDVVESDVEDEAKNEVNGTEEPNDSDKTEAADSDIAELEEFSSTVNPFQAFYQSRENGDPIVLKFYSDT